MVRTISHRGPDDEGLWYCPDAGIGLGHRRLSIIDTSAAGHQPMLSADERYVIAYNGEIYNFRELRRQLEDLRVRFRGHSDTEVLLAAVQRWGITSAVQRLAGMFAFALWDREARCLHLVRDRIGEKPLYYGWLGRTLLFGSELKAFRKFPGWHGALDRSALAQFLRYGYVRAPHSIYQGVKKVRAGTIISIDGVGQPTESEEQYWSAHQVAERGVADPLVATPDEIVCAFDARLRATVRQEMIADVPLGAFLSGGIDSSTIVAVMQAESMQPIRTFSIGFHETSYNEATHANAVAKHLGTDHTELYVTPEEALRIIPELPHIYDEPFADASQIPTILVSRLARREVTVSLSGDGGDELFCGYERYHRGARLWNYSRRVPRTFRRFVNRAVRLIPPRWWDRVLQPGRMALGSHTAPTGDAVHKLAAILDAPGVEQMFDELVAQWRDVSSVVVSSSNSPQTADVYTSPGFDDPSLRMMLLDLVSYLPDDILVKVDRAAMSTSLETRVPLVDHRVVEMAWQVPRHLRICPGTDKWLLRQVLYRYVPKSMVDRPKMGFGVPIETWLRGPLRGWADDLLDPTRLRQDGFLNERVIADTWSAHRSGRADRRFLLWDVLMFQSWLRAS